MFTNLLLTLLLVSSAAVEAATESEVPTPKKPDVQSEPTKPGESPEIELDEELEIVEPLVGTPAPTQKRSGGTVCTASSVRAFARYGLNDSGCPAQWNFGGGQYIEVSGSGAACTAVATCNAGGTVTCSVTKGDCTATRDNGDGYVDCSGTPTSC